MQAALSGVVFIHFHSCSEEVHPDCVSEMRHQIMSPLQSFVE